MLQAGETSEFLCSGRVALDRRDRQLRVSGRPVALNGLPLRLLEILMLADGRLVTRAELKAELWPYAMRIDTERRLNTAMRALRQAIGDSANAPAYIATVRGGGYRWIGRSAMSDPRSSRTGFRRFMFAAAASAVFTMVPGSTSMTDSIVPVPALQATGVEEARRLAWRLVNEQRPAAARPQLASLIATGAATSAEAADLGWLLMRAGSPEAALAICSGGELKPTLNLLSCRQTAFARLGQIASARSSGLQIMRLAEAKAEDVAAVERPAAALGYAAFLRWRLAHFVPPVGSWFQRAQLQADAGQYSEALVSLRRAAAARDPLLVKIGSSLEFEPLRASPEFRRIQDQAMNVLSDVAAASSLAPAAA